MTNDPIREKLLNGKELPLDDLNKVAGGEGENGRPEDVYCFVCRWYSHYGDLDPDWKQVVCLNCGSIITRTWATP